MGIHSTAIIEAGAEVGSDAEIGAFCVIGGGVRLGSVSVGSHVVIQGDTRIGDGTRISSFACIGDVPQISGYAGVLGGIEIGENCILREHVTVNSGSSKGNGLTRIGSDSFLMIGCHVAHDCDIGRGVIMANNAALGGHVEVGDYAVIGGLCGVHQWVRVGHHAMLGFMSAVDRDVIPYGVMQGERAHLEHFNWRRMKNGDGFDGDSRARALRFFDELFKCESESLHPHAESLRSIYGDDSFCLDILDFISATSRKGIAVPRRG